MWDLIQHSILNRRRKKGMKGFLRGIKNSLRIVDNLRNKPVNSQIEWINESSLLIGLLIGLSKKLKYLLGSIPKIGIILINIRLFKV